MNTEPSVAGFVEVPNEIEHLLLTFDKFLYIELPHFLQKS